MDGFRWLLGLDWGANGTNRIYTGGSSVASIRWSPIDDVIYGIRPSSDVAEVIRLVDRDSHTAEAEGRSTSLPSDPRNPYEQQASLYRLMVAGCSSCEALPTQTSGGFR